MEYPEGLRVVEETTQQFNKDNDLYAFYKVCFRKFELAHVQLLTADLLNQIVWLKEINDLCSKYDGLCFESITWHFKGWLGNKKDRWVFRFEYGGLHGVYVEREVEFDHPENSFALDYFQPDWIPGIIEEGKERLRAKCDYPLDDYPLQ